MVDGRQGDDVAMCPCGEALLALERAEAAASCRSERVLLTAAFINVTLALRVHEEGPPPSGPVGRMAGATVLGSDQG